MQDENIDVDFGITIDNSLKTSIYYLMMGLNFSDDVKLEILSMNAQRDGVGYIDIMQLFRLKEYVKLLEIIDKNRPLENWNVRSNYSFVKHKFIKAMK